MPQEILTHLPEILASLALIPDRYKERAFRYMGKLLPSSLSKPRYLELLKAHAEQRVSSINESRLLNVCKVCQRAGEILGQETSDIHSSIDNPFEDDWLNTFENEACQKSSEEMQERFARILAGEIERPGTFSIRAIKLLGQIDSETASIFRTFCSGCISCSDLSDSDPVYESIFPKFAVGRSNRFLEKYEISMLMLGYLQEFSLIPAEVNPSFLHTGFAISLKSSFIENIKKTRLPFLYAGKHFLLKPCTDGKNFDWDFMMPGILLSSVGQELINIVEPEPIKQLTEDLIEFFAEKQLELVEVELSNDKHWKPKH